MAHTFLCQSDPSPADAVAFFQSGFFFNEPEHLRQQTVGSYQLLSALNKCSGQADARCAFVVQSGKAVSPGAAPFGSVEFSETLPEAVLDSFINRLVDEAQLAGAESLRLGNYPACYAPVQTERLRAALAKHGFDLIQQYPTYFLPVSSTSAEQHFAPAERRRLRKCQWAGFQFSQLISPKFDQVVEFLQRTHRQKGYSLTLSPDKLTHLLRRFPDHFKIFTVTDDLLVIALSVAIQVRPDILYTFMLASDPDYASFSPMVLLIDGLFGYCQQQDIRLLDLGTSLDRNGQPKPGLIRFKRHLGAKESPKYIFEKTL